MAEGARRANGAKAPGHRSERGRFSCLAQAGGGPASFAGREPGDDLPRVGHVSGSAWPRRSFAGARRRSARPAERDEENARLKAKVGELTMEGEVLREKIDRLEAGRPLAGGGGGDEGPLHLPGRAYGLKRVCALGLVRAPRSTRNGGERRSPFMNALTSQ